MLDLLSCNSVFLKSILLRNTDDGWMSSHHPAHNSWHLFVLTNLKNITRLWPGSNSYEELSRVKGRSPLFSCQCWCVYECWGSNMHTSMNPAFSVPWVSQNILWGNRIRDDKSGRPVLLITSKFPPSIILIDGGHK